MVGQSLRSARCVVCDTPLDGPLSPFYRIVGIRRSRSNPNVCSRCNTHIEQGHVVELTILFADLASFTKMTHELGPERAHTIVDAFLQLGSDVLVRHDAFIDKYIGDSVMAIFNVPIQHPDHANHAVAAALELQACMEELRQEFGRNLQARISIASGWAHVGQLGSRERQDYTAIGEAVNLAARLEGETRAGEILLHDAVFDKVAVDFPGAAAETFTLKGFDEPVRAYRLLAQDGNLAVGRLAPYLEGVQHAGRRQVMSVGSTIFSILGAPCAAGAALGPAAVLVGLSSAATSLQSSLLTTLDAPQVRLPLQGMALLGMAANLYTMWRSGQLRKRAQAGGSVVTLTRRERRRNIVVMALAAVTVLALLAELYAHIFLMGGPLL